MPKATPQEAFDLLHDKVTRVAGDAEVMKRDIARLEGQMMAVLKHPESKEAERIRLEREGPRDTLQSLRENWLAAEKEIIRAAVADRGMPYLGFCLGHQLLADALGGTVGPAQSPEIGVMEVELTAAGRASPFYADMPARAKCLQWHGAEVTRAPAGADVLAASPACAVQALSVCGHAFSLQYHVELTPTTVAEWGAIPEYKAALEASLGAGALAGLEAETDAHMAAFNRDARQLYDNFMKTLG